MKYGIDYSPLSGQINIGRVNKAGTMFTSKEPLTLESVAAVCRYVLDRYPEGMTLRSADGEGWEIDVKALRDGGAA